MAKPARGRAGQRRTGTRASAPRCVLGGLLAALPFASPASLGEAMLKQTAARYATGNACSLGAEATNVYDMCTWVSSQGATAKGRLLVGFGEGSAEKPCNFTLQKCRKGSCYGALDRTATSHPLDASSWDENIGGAFMGAASAQRPQPRSIFSHLNTSVVGELSWGAKEEDGAPGGIQLKPAADGDVTVFYSTMSCAAFYAPRGGIASEQDCAAKLGSLSRLQQDLPVKGLCKHFKH